MASTDWKQEAQDVAYDVEQYPHKATASNWVILITDPEGEQLETFFEDHDMITFALWTKDHVTGGTIIWIQTLAEATALDVSNWFPDSAWFGATHANIEFWSWLDDLENERVGKAGSYVRGGNYHATGNSPIGRAWLEIKWREVRELNELSGDITDESGEE